MITVRVLTPSLTFLERILFLSLEEFVQYVGVDDRYNELSHVFSNTMKGNAEDVFSAEA